MPDNSIAFILQKMEDIALKVEGLRHAVQELVDCHGYVQPSVTPSRIRNVVAAEWNLNPKWLTWKQKWEPLATARHAMFHLCNSLLGMNSKSISREFHCNDSTVRHACTEIQKRLDVDSKFRARMERLTTMLAPEKE